MEFGTYKTHVLLRILAVFLLVFVACLLGFDAQTKDLLLVRKKATFRDLNCLYVWVYVCSFAAGYNLLRLCNIMFFSTWFEGNLNGSNIRLAWIGFLLDQIAVYVTFATNSAAVQGSSMAVTGQNDFQWMKLCDKFTRFCVQVGVALLFGYLACIVMALVSCFSAFNLFRLYSPKRFLLLKGT
ncbi:CASP-like protein 2C1 [Morus notabilis]|uniref:CASP-like protein 2C1 n=1 Tax=Morus notabilis TaxID=981085 RepID=UPI000CED68B7|nr:CASP-like protein 2C1 [Morus notabilis]